MLYNPDWQARDPDPLTLEKLAAWLETQPPEQTYCYLSTGECLLAQYLKAQGYAQAVVYSDFWKLRIGNLESIQFHMPSEINQIALVSSQTFGAALERCREAMAAKSKKTQTKEFAS